MQNVRAPGRVRPNSQHYRRASRTIGRVALLGSILASSVLAPPLARATPIQFAANFYDFVHVAQGINWEDAKNAAAASTFNGVTDHLATITTPAENNFLGTHFTTFPFVAGSWLGALVNTSGTGIWQVGPEAGEAFSQGQAALPGHYANWPPAGIEPNNASEFPDAVYMEIGTTYTDSNGSVFHGEWADAGSGIFDAGDPVVGYFIEYESPRLLPEPGSLALLALWLAALGIRPARGEVRGITHLRQQPAR